MSAPRRLRLWPRSLAFRVIAFSSLWAAVALVVIATVISGLFREVSERGFEGLLSAHLFNLISSVQVDEDGSLGGSANLGDLRFLRPNSGWYWAVEPASQGVTGELTSLSLSGVVAAPPTDVVPFDDEFQRRYQATGPGGELLDVIETEIELGSSDRIARFRMMGNRTELEADISTFAGRLYAYLGAFGAGMIAINAAAILLGLQPLRRVSRALADIRRGTSGKLDGEFPTEIAPLAGETNALIESNRRIVDRARTQVGNLAHSLKTPLAVMMNEGRALDGKQGRIFVEQAGAMQRQLDHYLQRARIAAQRESVVFRTPVAPLLERLVRVVRKLGAEKSVELAMPAEAVVFAGEKEDFEEIAGNLLDNAMKWSRARVRVAVERAELADGQPGFRLLVEDDGPGIPEDKAREAVKRGRRLDESKPGTGLGLAIVAELASEYGGRLSLERSTLGGLRAEVELRQAPE
jgi:signal transduction histidine kinase